MRDLFSDMTTQGHLVSAAVQRQAFAAWLRPGEAAGYSTLSMHILDQMPNINPSSAAASRSADRLVQKLRKAGFIVKSGRQWSLSSSGEQLLVQIRTDQL